MAVPAPRIVTRPYGRMFLEALPEGVEVEDCGAILTDDF
jgi:hypothetical protein